jgi:cytochrome c553/mono/diheme cytochrome c family protein
MPIRFTIFTILQLSLAPSIGYAADPDSVEFFESRIRPLLAEHCQQCHGAEKQKGNLRLDSREGWQRGGDSGPPILPGKPDASLLRKAISYSDRDLKMPPKKKLGANAIRDLETWIAMGAVDPRDAPVVAGHTKQKALSVAEGREFWSFKPVQSFQPPAVKQKDWPRNEIDFFILAKLEEKGLSPAPDASLLELRRRLSFDLAGVPPPENDDRDTDGLIAEIFQSPSFAERWSSHWLDLVRFAESSGGGRTLPFKDAWRYRDYVIESFQKDTPLDQFLTEQIAGDLLPYASAAQRRRNLTATGFLTLGATNYEEQDKQMLRMDIVDEQLDTMGKSILGMTIGCARCHDHKFDPIPTRDYYALAGILRSTQTLRNYTDNVAHWIDRPLPLDGEAEIAAVRSEKEIADLKKEIASIKDQLRSSGSGIRPKGSRALAVSELEGIVVDDAEAMKVGAWRISSRTKPYIGSGYSHDDNMEKGSRTLSFTPKIAKTGKYEVRVAHNAGPTRAESVDVTIFHADGEDLVPFKAKTEAIEGLAFSSLGVFRFEDSSQGYVLISNGGTQGYVAIDAVQFIPQDTNDSPSPPTETPSSKTKGSELTSLKSKQNELETKLKAVLKTSQQRPEVMSVMDDTKPEDSPIHIRGSIRNLGTPVPRGFLQVALQGDAPPIPENESGRMQLAHWLTDPRHPLTARVYVNRVWYWLMGAGIVRTTDNFGVTGELPSHPELLDYLAFRFVEDGWSTRKLVSLIVNSRTYRQTSDLAAQSPRLKEIDPDNRLLSRMNRKRLDAECLRDAMLSVSGTLENGVGGPNLSAGKADSNSSETQNLEYNFKYIDRRRSLYTPAFRNVRHPLFEVFDFADINQPIPQRTTSTVATQALFMTNSSFVIDEAKAAAIRLLKDSSENKTRIQRAFQLSFGRLPTEPELAASLDFVDSSTSGNAEKEEIRDVWARLIQTLWATPEFRFLK